MAQRTKTGGREAGTPNKLTRDARETFRLLFEALVPEAEGWIRATAKRNPAKAAELLLKVSEMFVPRPVRQEPSASTGEPFDHEQRGTLGRMSVEELERIATGEDFVERPARAAARGE